MQDERVHVDLDQLRQRLSKTFAQPFTAAEAIDFLMAADATYLGNGWFLAGIRVRARLMSEEILERQLAPPPPAAPARTRNEQPCDQPTQ